MSDPNRPVAMFFASQCFLNKETGSQWRNYSIVKHLDENGFRVVVYGYLDNAVYPWDPDGRERFEAAFPNAVLVLERRPRALRLAARVKKLMTGLLPGRTAAIARFSIDRWTPELARLKARYPTARWVVSYADALLDLNGIDLARTAVDTVDLQFVQTARVFSLPIWHLRPTLKFRSEMSLLQDCGLVVSLANADTTVYRFCLEGRSILLIHDFATVPVLVDRVAARRRDDGPRLLFVGADMGFNRDGIVGFLRDHRDVVETHGLRIAGKVSRNPAVAAAARGIANVDLLGFVDDLTPLYAQASAVISPVEGTGIKIKLLEALSAGLPVFASAHSIEALPPGYEDCVLPIDGGLSSILEDPEAIARASQAADRYYASFGKNEDIGRFEAWLRQSDTGSVAS